MGRRGKANMGEKALGKEFAVLKSPFPQEEALIKLLLPPLISPLHGRELTPGTRSVPSRLSWRHRARPSATLDEIQPLEPIFNCLAQHMRACPNCQPKSAPSPSRQASLQRQLRALVQWRLPGEPTGEGRLDNSWQAKLGGRHQSPFPEGGISVSCLGTHGNSPCHHLPVQGGKRVTYAL